MESRVLYQRERERREALWRLDSLRPGDPNAVPLLEVLSRIDDEETAIPIGEGRELGVEDLRSMVEVVKTEGRIAYVKDDSIPQPWLERLSQAGTGSTRYPEGFYVHDWYKFLDLWPLEMAMIDAHKKARGGPLA